MPAANGAPIWSDFAEYQNNPAVAMLANQARWTISGKIDKERKGKAPIDVKRLIYGDKQLRGAYAINETCLMTLPELNHFFPTATNNAFYLAASVDGLLVLDIEPTCPVAVRDQLLALPCYYVEYSMSGRGFHLVMPKPKNFDEFPIAIGKTNLQEEHKWFEILINHWVTFTRRPVAGIALMDPAAGGCEMPREAGPGEDVMGPGEGWMPGTSDHRPSWEAVWEFLAKDAKESVKADFDVDDDAPELPYHDVIVGFLERTQTRSLGEFKGSCNCSQDEEWHDHSAWEFSVMGSMANTLDNVLLATDIANAREWSEADRAWLIYDAARKIIPYRDKHEQTRQGLPFLLYTAQTLIARRGH